MNLTLWLGRYLVKQLNPNDLVELGVAMGPQIQKRIPPEQRVEFLRNIAEKNLKTFLADMSREERASLMNALLPLVAREFPLSDLDFLTAFPSPGKDNQAESSY